jgi:hypothetical protein
MDTLLRSVAAELAERQAVIERASRSPLAALTWEQPVPVVQEIQPAEFATERTVCGPVELSLPPLEPSRLWPVSAAREEANECIVSGVG